jgi:hypothetical protein
MWNLQIALHNEIFSFIYVDSCFLILHLYKNYSFLVDLYSRVDNFLIQVTLYLLVNSLVIILLLVRQANE